MLQENLGQTMLFQCPWPWEMRVSLIGYCDKEYGKVPKKCCLFCRVHVEFICVMDIFVSPWVASPNWAFRVTPPWLRQITKELRKLQSRKSNWDTGLPSLSPSGQEGPSLLFVPHPEVVYSRGERGGDEDLLQTSHEKRPKSMKEKFSDSTTWSNEGKTTSCKASYDFISISRFISLSFIMLNPFVKSCLNALYLSLWALQYKERGLRSIRDPGVKVERVSSSSLPLPSQGSSWNDHCWEDKK